jgi:membrane-bound lytic murein transglycosylase F
MQLKHRGAFMDTRKRIAIKRWTITKVFFVLLMICSSGLLVRSAPVSQLEEVLTSGELRVISRNGPTTFYEGANGLTGFEYTLLQSFAQSLGVKLVIVDDDKTVKARFKMNTDTFDLASASMVTKLGSTHHLRFTAPYMEVTHQLIYNTTHTAPANLNDLLNKNIVVLAKSTQREQLHNLQKSLPELRWTEVEGVEVIDLLDMVEQGTADYAVVDSAMYALYRYSYPNTQFALNLNSPQPIAWALTQSRDNSLYDAAQKHLVMIRQNGLLAQVTARFFDQFEPLETVTTGDAMMFSYRLEKRLPQWEKTIKAVATEYELDWKLLAATGYQESHWDPQAESVTGVRGFMMLTLDTAKELGVIDREDPYQSIKGGAKYIKNLGARLPDRIVGEDRLYMTLAAYNLGLGHLEDARVLTEKMGGNPNLWADVSQYFPLLAKHQYYSAAKHGYARGWEPVTYVQNIINYHKILTWHEQHEQFRLATLNVNLDIEANSASTQTTASEKLSKNNLDKSSSLSIL